MPVRRPMRLFLFLAVGLASVSAMAAPPTLRIPLPDQRGVSATFGEYREGHLHTGVDLRTGGRNGLPVVAAASGRLVRMRSTRRGYGNVLYVEHDGGWVTVYAHLERFADGPLSRLLDDARVRNGRYPDEIAVDGTIRVAAGEVIAYSGESGAGLPHLHFELRDPTGEPINPLHYLAGFRDQEAPRLRRVRWLPVDATSRIDGDFRSRVDPLGGDAGPPPRLAGRIAVEVQADDRLTSDNRCGVYEVGLEVDGRPHYRLRFDRLRFDRVPFSGLLYDLPGSALGPVRFIYKLYREAGNDLRPVMADGDGLIDTRALADGRHRLTFFTADAHGQRSRAAMEIEVANGVRPVPVVARTGNGGGRVELRQVDTTLVCRLRAGEMTIGEPRLRIQIDGVEVAAPPLEVTPNGDYLATLPLTPGMGRRADAWVPGIRSRPSIPLSWISPEAATNHRHGPFELYFPVGAAFAPSGLALRQVGLPAAERLPVRAGPVAVTPSGRMLRAAATATFHLSEMDDGQRLGIYRWSPASERWRYVGGHWDAARHILSAGVRDLATLAVLEDRWVPRIADTRPHDGAVLTAWPDRAYVAVEERGEGVNEEACRVELDGVPLRFEYDPDRRWLRLEPDGLPGSGEHRLTIRVADTAGNQSRPTTLTFTLEPTAS
ncbi:MAG: peptidoglycan DD-metalloendopeptidase family protein [Nitrospirota bacterium]